MARVRPEDAAAGQVPAADLEDALFGTLRQQLESMISWAKSEEALALEHDQFESRALTEGFEVMRIFTEAHLGLRAAREQRRTDVADAGGDLRVSTEDGQEHTRMMVYGPVRTSRIAYKRHRRPNLYPQDAELNWATGHSYSAGVVKRVAKASGVVPFAQAAAQVSEAGAITVGKRQAEQLAIGAAIDFEAFYAARRPQPSPAGTGLLITADGSAFSVRPEALRPATAKAARARQRAAAASGWPEDPADLRKSKKRSAELAGIADIPPPAPQATSSPPCSRPRTPAAARVTAMPRPPVTARRPRARRCSPRPANRSRPSSARPSPRLTAATPATCGPGSPSWTAITPRSARSAPTRPSTR